MADPTLLTLRVTGLGHKLTLQVAASATVLDLKECIETSTNIPPEYQRLLAPQAKKLEDDGASLTDAGVKDRTKIMIVHSSLYAQEKEGYEKLSALAKEIDELSSTSGPPHVLAEMVTRICCRLDEVDTKGSEKLRERRRNLLRKAEKLE